MSKTVIAAIIFLVIGFGGGYIIANNGAPAPATHTMSDGSTMLNTMASMTAGLEGKTGDIFDRAFLEEMIVHHEGAVAMARLALSHAQHAEIKQMAEDIIDAQTREISSMRGWLELWYGTGQ